MTPAELKIKASNHRQLFDALRDMWFEAAVKGKMTEWKKVAYSIIELVGDEHLEENIKQGAADE